MTRLSFKILQAVTKEVAELLRKEKGRIVPKNVPDLIRTVLVSYNLDTNRDTVSKIATCLSKRRVPGKKEAPRNGDSVLRKIRAEELLEGAEIAEDNHRKILGDDY